MKGHILQCLLCIGTVPRPVVTYFKYLLMYTRYFDTLKDTLLFKTLIVELHTKKKQKNNMNQAAPLVLTWTTW